jgi:hypothetical protein
MGLGDLGFDISAFSKGFKHENPWDALVDEDADW